MKGYTDLEQSKKLAGILPITSIDFAWNIFSDGSTRLLRMDDWEVSENAKSNVEIIPCWSLGALLEFLPKIVNTETLFIETSATLWHVGYRNVHTAIETYLIDACYELIIKLKTLNLL